MIRKMIDDIQKLVSKFRVLDDWNISYDPHSDYKGQCAINEDTKEADIYGWGVLQTQPDDYLIHEVLHIAFRAAKRVGREGEELFIQDLCTMLSGALNDERLDQEGR